MRVTQRSPQSPGQPQLTHLRILSAAELRRSYSGSGAEAHLSTHPPMTPAPLGSLRLLLRAQQQLGGSSAARTPLVRGRLLSARLPRGERAWEKRGWVGPGETTPTNPVPAGLGQRAQLGEAAARFRRQCHRRWHCNREERSGSSSRYRGAGAVRAERQGLCPPEWARGPTQALSRGG